MSQLFSLSFWFSLQTTGLSATFEHVFFFLFAIVIILGSISRIMARNKKDDRFMVKVYKYLGQMCMTMGVTGLVWFFLAYEQIYFFGARFWFLAWVLGLIVWSAWIVWYAKVRIPELKDQGVAKVETNKYIPKSKRK
ncbi:MAG: hypothetical protein UU40_C0012G0015 [Candidatus Uhrbacteria bacterium GW2011_GWD2_41_121]|uniref:Uncharacterized protein n=1 Tax=Candidatus Uhrbacteria bacterium GW2011_GWC1_41_20 TaxID=1618983 RepID=A0A0G0VDB3_9BACT|nr:MAG: hypothetical protein UT52_C0004G0015 [Candidatus Uhrbacteria bacterium GW2011_GWE1_39_46]KKR63789.1 MAG: hypothetical protein UU04_C0012G0027 [Candidatus Uhrbacteria bacterium GW2011_GWC2_40_450]KKR89907.1 MAG: hypothetical protein UU40_C0012G0015 [Candidatus Uhrbacteria bacterium GW2011_GWD2_41_121]KKR95777.1 MAG: hypothetical protein UU46_C0014G0015 [Candidatus Uhrbacteria bacterium GW2011_GWD1_41_16]KKR98879.1 MAG: hypothetical protein UU50_C0014G0011 [Candidatus Uhrbacteria bacteriu